MKFEIIIKDGPNEISHIVGRINVSVTDPGTALLRVIETEQLLERLLGYRVHINTVPEEQTKTRRN
jgi:hypothetical protein